MSGVFNRTLPPFKYKNYGKYKSQLRLDFKESCAYCLIHEDYLGGDRAFEIDHQNPRDNDPSLISHYPNLFWSCGVCNGIKAAKWPNEEESSRGEGYIDTTEDLYSEHFRIDLEGRIYSLSDIGVYTRFNIGLDRPNLNKVRRRLINLAQNVGITIDWNKPLADILDDIEPKAVKVV